MPRRQVAEASAALMQGESAQLGGGPGAGRLRDRMRDELIAIVAAADAPVPMAAAAQRIRDSLGVDVRESNWGGYGGFGKLAESATCDRLQVSGPPRPNRADR